MHSSIRIIRLGVLFSIIVCFSSAYAATVTIYGAEVCKETQDPNGPTYFSVYYTLTPDSYIDFPGCAHGARDVTWTPTPISGSGTSHNDRALLEFDGTGQKTISVTVGSLPQLNCSPGYSHSGDHSGGSDTTSVEIYWVSILAVTPTVERGSDGTFLVVYLGQGSPVYKWSSDQTIPAGLIHTGGGLWSGTMVQPQTSISVNVEVPCPYGPSTHIVSRGPKNVTVTPRDWSITATLGATDLNWGQGDESFMIFSSKPIGQNTNVDIRYENNSGMIITPRYGRGPNGDPSVTWQTEVPSGPNIGWHYNTDPGMYKIDRKIRINDWAQANSPAPSWWSYSSPRINWYTYNEDAILTFPFDLEFPLSSHSLHSANLAHEGRGSGPNASELGHFSRMETYLATPQSNGDAMRLVEDNTSDRVRGLRSQNEADRFAASDKLFQDTISIDVTGGVTKFSPFDWHNWAGSFWLWSAPGAPVQSTSRAW